MASGFDTTANAGHLAPLIKSSGYDFVGRYLSKSTWKTISHQEAAALKEADLGIVLIYEDGPTSVSYFSNGRGASDAARALTQAGTLGAPCGTAIYFTVDYDANPDELAGPIANYFNEVVATLAADPSGYVAGVYGSGHTCQSVSASAGAPYTWRAQSKGWAGYALPGPWSIVQGATAAACTLSVDLDSSGPAPYGAM